MARCLHNITPEERNEMKYLAAWMLGIPGGIIVLWFLLNQTAC